MAAAKTPRNAAGNAGKNTVGHVSENEPESVPVNLEKYFKTLLEKVEASSEITNGGKDKEGFYLPTRSVLLQKLNMLKDLHANKNAKPMVRDAWSFVVEHLPPEWLILNSAEKSAVKSMLA